MKAGTRGAENYYYIRITKREADEHHAHSALARHMPAFSVKAATFEMWTCVLGDIGYLPFVSTFCFSSSFIFLTVAFWLLSPIV